MSHRNRVGDRCRDVVDFPQWKSFGGVNVLRSAVVSVELDVNWGEAGGGKGNLLSP